MGVWRLGIGVSIEGDRLENRSGGGDATGRTPYRERWFGGLGQMCRSQGAVPLSDLGHAEQGQVLLRRLADQELEDVWRRGGASVGDADDVGPRRQRADELLGLSPRPRGAQQHV